MMTDDRVFIRLFWFTLGSIFIIDPLLFWSDEIYLFLNSSNDTIVWLEDPWLFIYSTLIEEISCTDLSPGACKFSTAGSILFHLLYYSMCAFIFIGLPTMLAYENDEYITDNTLRQLIAWSTKHISNRFPFKEPSIVYSLRNLIDYVIIVGVFFPQFRLSRFHLIALTILLTRIGQLFSITSLQSLYFCSRTFLIDTIFLACINQIDGYSHIVTRNAMCFAVGAFIKSRLLTKFCTYWFVRSTENLPLPNPKFERNLPRIKSDKFLLDDLVFVCDNKFAAGPKNQKQLKPPYMYDRIFLLDEFFITIIVIVIASIDSEFGNNIDIFVSFFCALILTVYFCRGVSGSISQKQKIFVGSFSQIERKYIFFTNWCASEAFLTVFAVCFYFNPSLNCFASLLVVCILSIITARVTQIFNLLRLPRLLIIFDLLTIAISCLSLFVGQSYFSDVNQFLFARLHSPLILLLLLSQLSHISMGLVTLQTVFINRLIYNITKKLSQQYCFHFEDQGYILVKEFSWRDPEEISKLSGYQVEVNGFYDRRTLEKLGVSLDDCCVFVKNLADLNAYGEKIKKCVKNRLEEYNIDVDFVKELRKRQKPSTESKTSDIINAMEYYYDHICDYLFDVVVSVQEDSQHWIADVKKALFVNESQVKKFTTEYETIKKSLHDLFNIFTFLKQKPSFLKVEEVKCDAKHYGSQKHTEKLLIETKTLLEDAFNSIFIPASDTLSRNESNEQKINRKERGDSCCGAKVFLPQILDEVIKQALNEVEKSDAETPANKENTHTQLAVDDYKQTPIVSSNQTQQHPQQEKLMTHSQVDEPPKNRIASAQSLVQPLNATIFVLCTDCNAKLRNGSVTELEDKRFGLQIIMCSSCVDANLSIRSPCPK